MANVRIEKQDLQNIADAIRDKTSKVDKMKVSNMAEEITNIPSGSSIEGPRADYLVRNVSFNDVEGVNWGFKPQPCPTTSIIKYKNSSDTIFPNSYTVNNSNKISFHNNAGGGYVSKSLNEIVADFPYWYAEISYTKGDMYGNVDDTTFTCSFMIQFTKVPAEDLSFDSSSEYISMNYGQMFTGIEAYTVNANNTYYDTTEAETQTTNLNDLLNNFTNYIMDATHFPPNVSGSFGLWMSHPFVDDSMGYKGAGYGNWDQNQIYYM